MAKRAKTEDAATEVVEVKKKSTGYRSAIRLGETTAKEAYKALKRKFDYLHPATAAWYEQRIAKEKT